MGSIEKKSIFTSVLLSLLVHSLVIAALAGGVSLFNGTSKKSGKGLGVGAEKEMPQYIQVSSIQVEPVNSSIKNKTDLKDSISIKKVVKKEPAQRNSPSAVSLKRNLGTSGSIDRGGSGSEGRVTELSLYVQKVKKLIAEKSFYPRSAKRRGIEGTVNISFSVRADGVLYDIDISKPSGSNLLDENALAIVKSVSPLPKPPRDDLRLELPLVFSIKTIW